ncbi:hypothetical protein Q8A67_009392 [Cirrhinus molitorella]|uniref:Phospholipid scramblase n=1 Tax=Cirrhinus molitorella TaxID=172907 RepID=A0AA88PW49_9TELE|nr:hypothetical protein Q8A67_009392 [Cirrhinus molitorella]
MVFSSAGNTSVFSSPEQSVVFCFTIVVFGSICTTLEVLCSTVVVFSIVCSTLAPCFNGSTLTPYTAQSPLSTQSALAPPLLDQPQNPHLGITAMIPSPDPYHFPSHLKTLTRMDQLFVFKEITMEEHLQEVCFGIKPIKRFNVKDDTGNKVFSIVEDSDRCGRQFYGRTRSFIMNVTDHANQIIRLVHPSVFCCSSHELEVQSPPGTPIGYVQQNLHVCLPKLTVANGRGEPAFKIEGPCLGCTSCYQNFELVSLNGAAIERSFGKIFKPFSCSGPNAVAAFVLQFPSYLDVKMKAAVLGACMLIETDLVYHVKRGIKLL